MSNNILPEAGSNLRGQGTRRLRWTCLYPVVPVQEMIIFLTGSRLSLFRALRFYHGIDGLSKTGTTQNPRFHRRFAAS